MSTNSTDWWQEFFGESWSAIQGDGYPAERTSAECDLIQSTLGLPAGARVLDIPCGIGRHSVELARRGFRMTGVDFKPEYVATAEASARQAGVEPRFLVGDMRTFRSEQPFDAAFCFFGSFGYFSEADDLSFARSVGSALRPAGRFLIEGHVCETIMPIFRERDWIWAGSPERRVRLLEERTWNLETSRIDSTLTIIGEDGVRPARMSIRIYSVRELRALLEAAGFVRVDVRDRQTGQPLRVGSPRALVVAEKAA